ncbi:hypothetical protein NV63_00230 [Elizabethkingia anophelis]|nr:hypothetical protein NV63_00230 [Elizabethkingia anophelis]
MGLIRLDALAGTGRSIVNGTVFCSISFSVISVAGASARLAEIPYKLTFSFAFVILNVSVPVNSILTFFLVRRCFFRRRRCICHGLFWRITAACQ